ncbi:pseudaminic acid biosynthesis-associated methylase [Aliikangiella sp. G2MR2-5]|uniref:pseudaminic acid biosynthesis-associated methylase n=1 Tax=Aliikangiella sp. G2MR2-5 TaxID=2788943 RepID=UPI0018AA1B0C|nr:pseudaminic acid biosynthesis-associated methylase [Aliikangiella sp. G2MR2-5]
MGYKTEQEIFWAGDFGDEYALRNESETIVASNTMLFSKVLSATEKIESIIEFGANIGMNLRALQHLLPNVRASAIEINQKAADRLRELNDIEVYQTSILEYQPVDLFDLVLIKGVLIHINPDELPSVYDKLFASTRRYLLVAEYYNPSPVSVDYRNNKDRLFKRDFAGELLDRFNSLRLLDYGFCYHRDNQFPLDDITWFLLEKEKN